MELENKPAIESKNKFNNLYTVTLFSKYFALALFIALPFVGGWVGYRYAKLDAETKYFPNTYSLKYAYVDSEVNDGGNIIDETEARKEYVPRFANTTVSTTTGSQYHPQLEASTNRTFYIYDFTESGEDNSQPVDLPDQVSEKYSASYTQDTFFLNDYSVQLPEALEGSFTEDGLFLRLLLPDMYTQEATVVIRNDIDPTSYEPINYYFAKDRNRVYFLGIGTFAAGNATILQLNPERATTSIPALGEKFDSFVTDGSKLYFQGLLLEGIDPHTMTYNFGYIRDDDTIWFSNGNCHFMSYRPGTLDELETYTPPC